MNHSRYSEIDRRGFLKFSAAGASVVGCSGWLDVLAARAAASGRKYKSCVLLWMVGGPSHKDTFDLKPGTKDGGEFKPIQTSAPGVEISEHFPKLAKLMHHAAVLRGMSTKEGAHGRARYFMHTGYREGVGGLVYPSLGAIASAELGRPDFPLPNFVSVGRGAYGAGFLGPHHQPLNVDNPARGVEDLAPSVDAGAFGKRVGLLEEMEANFGRRKSADAVAAHATAYQRAVTLMRSRESRAFDLSQEPAAVREKYGGGRFGDGCLLARRLVEAGVPFVEVSMGGWDTHQQNFERVKKNSQEVDPAVASLVTELEERGLLDSTLVIWMGEFGRTPKINKRGPKPGRDHYPRAWSTVLLGGGIKGGQVVGKTDAEGAAVVERPISELDFLSTVCLALGIDYTKENMTPIRRPIRIVDKGARPVAEVLG